MQVNTIHLKESIKKINVFIHVKMEDTFIFCTHNQILNDVNMQIVIV